MNALAKRPLPSIDWIALGIGMVGLVLSRIQAPGSSGWLGLLGLAVFGPPILRETGLLKDDDEFTRNIRWRAGFHAALLAGVAIFLNFVVMGTYMDNPEAMRQKMWLFPMNQLRQLLVLVFLFSYLIQYWGARLGVFRIMRGLFVLFLVEYGMGLAQARHLPAEGMRGAITGVMVLFLVFLVGGAFLARRRPRLTGQIMLGLGVLFLLFAGYELMTFPPSADVMGGLSTKLGMVSGMLQILLVFGILGLSLLQSEPDEV